MRDLKFVLPLIPMGYLLGAYMLFLEGLKTAAWIFFFASLLFSIMVIGINVKK